MSLYSNFLQIEKYKEQARCQNGVDLPHGYQDGQNLKNLNGLKKQRKKRHIFLKRDPPRMKRKSE